jgi:transposase, IS5 family
MLLVFYELEKFKVQVFMRKTTKKRAPKSVYISPKQLTIQGFETPFHNGLLKSNRWVKLADIIPWDELVSAYLKRNPTKSTGRPGANPRVVIGAVIIKHLCNLDDRETISQITENLYFQYFLGYSSFSHEPPFDPSLFVEIRKRMGDELIAEMNSRIYEISKSISTGKEDETAPKPKKDDDTGNDSNDTINGNRGELLMDATVCPQDIAYPTDINLLNEAREISEHIISVLHKQTGATEKPRTYPKIARREYLKVAQNKRPTRKLIRKGISKQLRYLRRNFKVIEKQLDGFGTSIPLSKKLLQKYWIIQTLYDQQLEMYLGRKHQVANRIISIHQPHVRPIVRGKSRSQTEFGSKIHLSMVDGYCFLDQISWDAFNEGSYLTKYVENYKTRFGFYPAKVLADKLYCTRENRKWLKERGIKLAAKPLGRPSSVKAVENHVSPGERNPIEGKFGQAKNGYGMNRIRARLKNTSQSWISSIILVLNLVKLAGLAPLCLSFSAYDRLKMLLNYTNYIIKNLINRTNQPYAAYGWFYNQI